MTITLGYTTFYVDDVRSTLDFYINAFGFDEKLATPEGDYGELATGTTTLAFVANTLADDNLASAGGFTRYEPTSPPPGASITLTTTNVASTVESAITAGARRYVDPIDKPWGQTVAYLLDPNGVLLEIATPIPG